MKAIVAALAPTLAALGVDVWFLRSEAAREVLVPSPSRVIQTFIGSLAAKRPEVAREHMAEALRARVSRDDLRTWADDLRARHGEIDVL
jgi:hypothetical protein